MPRMGVETMLVLSRKTMQRVVIADAIRITILKVDRGSIRLGIEAPDDVRVVREELLLDAEDLVGRAEWERSA